LLVRDHFARAASLFSERIAIICDGEQRSYQELNERSNRLANALLAFGLVRGDRVAVLLENSIAALEIDCACTKIGLVRVSLNPRTTKRDAEFIIKDAQARILFFGWNFATLVSDLTDMHEGMRHVGIAVSGSPTGEFHADDYEGLIAGGGRNAPDTALDDEDLHSLLYTSGTSGRPKGVMLSNRAIVQVAYNVLIELPPLTINERILLLQPLSHGAAFYVLPYFMRGCTVVLTRRFDPEDTLHLIRELGIGVVKLVPTMLHRLLSSSGVSRLELPQLHRLIYGGSAIPGEVLRQAIEVFGTRLVQHYGQSEAPSTLTLLPQAEHVVGNIETGLLNSAGRAWPTVDIRIVGKDGQTLPKGDVGEVAVRAPHLMSGYWQNPDLSAKVIRDGWLFTNDLGHLDDRGFLYLAGRMDEMIISGGFNIAPRDVEEVLYRHPAVHEVAVVGQLDVRWGHVVVAYVALKPDATAVNILEFSKPLLGFKNPKRLYIVNELPKNLNGKIERKSLNPALVT
jgi:long-chain acyl-CoA synthetase